VWCETILGGKKGKERLCTGGLDIPDCDAIEGRDLCAGFERNGRDIAAKKSANGHGRGFSSKWAEEKNQWEKNMGGVGGVQQKRKLSPHRA